MTGRWKLKRCFLGPKKLKKYLVLYSHMTFRINKNVCMYQCGRVFVVLEDSVLTGYFRTKQSLFVKYFIFSEGKSEQIYLLATKPFLSQTEKRRLNTYSILFLFFIYILLMFYRIL